ncbi:rhodanese-like domain-containing protein [Lewinella sp. W8]|uniref:rhodanese-like domain-containing protein n=1 Tax=Lewinella sp. W8 TaxID=2528208 RepID=UPI0010678943|nr:rhodanese-like domain-containing protein [Lewinella sp. W8]MTB52496.1 rhodanese-like domain-containing protein [Lewinella sp. W8]
MTRILFALLLSVTLCTCGDAQKTDATASVEAASESPYLDLSVEEFAEKIGQENTVLIDVRTPAEIANGKIEGALEMDYRSPDFAGQLQELDPSKTYLVYCASGGRSGNTCALLAEGGFQNLYNLEGGYNAWKAKE